MTLRTREDGEEGAADDAHDDEWRRGNDSHLRVRKDALNVERIPMLLFVLLERSSVPVDAQTTTGLLVHVVCTDASPLDIAIDARRSRVLLCGVPLQLPTGIDVNHSVTRSSTSSAALGSAVTLLLALQRDRVSLLRAPRFVAGDGQLAPTSELTRLLCRSCAAPVVDGSSWRRVLPLPSPAWLELTDLWHCRCGHAHVDEQHTHEQHHHEHDEHEHDEHDHDEHEHDDAYNCRNHEHRAARSHRPIHAQPDLLLADSATLLVHSSGVFRDAVLVNRDAPVSHFFGLDVAPEDRGNASLECRQCGVQLGYVADTGVLDLLESNDVRLFTRRISAQSEHFSVKRLLAATLESDVAEDIAFHVQQTQQRRFVVRRRGARFADDKHAVLLLLVLNDDWLAYLMQIDTRDKEELDLAGQLRPHVKLAYRVCDADIDSAIEIERWSRDLRAQTLLYDGAVCDELMRALPAFTNQLPPLLRKFDDMSVGALERSSR